MGIDGLDGCRKTTLAVELAGHTDYQVISLDDFLDEKRDAYVNHIDFDRVQRAVEGRNSIVEGVCLLKVLERAGLKLDLAIYVQKYRHGLWADEDWLGLDQNVETSAYGPSTKAFLVVPLVGAFFIDILNAGVINFFIGIIKNYLL